MMSFLLTRIYLIFEKSKAMAVSLGNKTAYHKKQKHMALGEPDIFVCCYL